MRRILAVLLTAGITGVAALSGCAPSDNGSASSTAPATSPSTVVSPTSPTGASAAPAAAPESLRFVASTVDGQSFDAAPLAGKPAVLWFWAAWCPKCRAAADDVAAVSRDYSGRVAVVGMVARLRRAAPVVNRLGGALLVAVGAYVA